MSWQAYIDTNLVGTQRVSQAAIIGLNPSQVWAKSTDLELSKDELQSLATAFDNLDTVQSSGLRISDKKYFFLSASSSEGSIQLKKGPDGACLFKTEKAIILGVYSAPIQQTECFDVVFSLGKYLKELNY